MTKMNEIEMVAAIVRGDPKAEKNFVDIYYQKIKLIVDVRMRNREDKEEMINDILVATIIKIREQQYISSNNSNLSKYVHGIARNNINQYYKDYYYRNDKEDQFRATSSEMQKTVDFDEVDYEEKEEIENKQRIWAKSISKLKLKYQKVLYLKYYESLSITEISKEMNIPPQKVSDYLKYSRQLLLKDVKLKKLRIFPYFLNIL